MENSLPSPIQYKCKINADRNLRGRDGARGTRFGRQDVAWSDKTSPGRGLPLIHLGHEKQGMLACRQLSASLGWTVERPNDGTPL